MEVLAKMVLGGTIMAFCWGFGSFLASLFYGALGYGSWFKLNGRLDTWIRSFATEEDRAVFAMVMLNRWGRMVCRQCFALHIQTFQLKRLSCRHVSLCCHGCGKLDTVRASDLRLLRALERGPGP